jgi:asparaginyl-tRNA synthetase
MVPIPTESVFHGRHRRSLYRTPPKADQPRRVSGWVRTMRESKAFAFIELSDGTFFKPLQLVLEEERLPDYRALTRAIGVGASVEAEGTLVLTPGAKQPFELKVDALTVIGVSPGDYPLQKKRHTLEYLRTIAHLRPRANLFSARSAPAPSPLRRCTLMHDRGFVYVHHPIFTAATARARARLFQVTTLTSPTLPAPTPARWTLTRTSSESRYR